MSNTLDAKILANMFLAGAKNLETKKDWINELNVFPVPDGDTGTNMTMTIMSAAKDVAALCSTNDADMMTVCKAISSGSLRGARGNSGVILSQLLRGFTKTVRESEEIDIPLIAEATTKAVETAYKAVMKPKEGTILTVAKGVSDKAVELAADGCDNLEDFFTQVIAYGDEVLSKTPDMLPVLKQAGVVDSGGQGLMEVLRGAFDGFMGKEVDLSIASSTPTTQQAGFGTPNLSVQAEADIKFGYCTEFIILLKGPFNIKMEMDFKAFLESIGDSIVCVADEDVVKVHVHTNDPGLAIQRALKYGQLSNMKIDNMRIEHQEKLFKQSEMENSAKEPEMEHKDVAFVAVSVGSGINDIFKSLGADYIIEGGQTMNPSTDDILNAIEKVNADTIFVLPNNKNIIMAANQAKVMTEDKNIIVIPTKNIPQGITAMISYVPGMNVDDNAATMECEIKNVMTGEVTYAVRDTVIEDKEIHTGDYMGIGDNGIICVGKDRDAVTFEVIEDFVSKDCEIISVYYGQDVNENDAEAILNKIKDEYPDCEVDLQFGGQPVYSYIISGE